MGGELIKVCCVMLARSWFRVTARQYQKRTYSHAMRITNLPPYIISLMRHETCWKTTCLAHLTACQVGCKKAIKRILFGGGAGVDPSAVDVTL